MITLNSTDFTTYLNRAVCFFHTFDQLFFIMIMNRLHLVECLNERMRTEAITGFIPLPTVEATPLSHEDNRIVKCLLLFVYIQ